ncbi:FAD-binding oxidoreductase [Tropicibacter oceani]|uniref:FAD-binding oxidoreductase n=1 Tax=Tropicibacter oceani TaxID=3058420 RepID=A0ABY8QM49_9RHOB|nr:FAD-binding oxidoreductase [Tropicibacter oceani]WGW05533.1 FAD-binding oxidoreductase [Tropicibacter oceani]
MSLVDTLTRALGADAVLTGGDMAPWTRDWTGQYRWTPLCVARPADRDGVAAVLSAAHQAGVAVVPVGGNTGLSGGTMAEGAVMLSLDRMNTVREIRPEARLAVVEAGVILSNLHEAAADHGLSFPMTFGARGSCTLGGILATNAGGSNVLRHGNTRDLVLGVEVVLADGRVIDLMSELHKDNTGLNLRHLMIGSEGVLGVITAAVVKLVPAPRAYATAMVAVASLDQALVLLNRLQEATGGQVEAFEYMPRRFVEEYGKLHPETRPPFDQGHDVNLLIELGATAPRDVDPDPDGQVPVARYLEDVLAGMLEDGAVLDAVVARSEAQRRAFWARREAAAEVSTSRPVVLTDVAVPLDKVSEFLLRAEARLAALDPQAVPMVVAHLGDGNVHCSVWIGVDAAGRNQIMEAVEEEALALGGSFSAEHGIGISKRPAMARFKDPVALEIMRGIKAVMDPKGILNPGKVIP